MKRLSCLILALVLMLSVLGCSNAPAPASTATVPETTCFTEPAADKPTVKWYDDTICITAQQADRIVNSQFDTPKNVILLIGDGMGPNDITLCSQFGTDNFDFGLVLERIPHHGLCTTRSASHKVTDSAASATALATGVKTANGYVGMLKDGTALQNLSEIAREQGKKVGIVTDDEITGATPSAFLTHNKSRKNYDAIYADALEFAPDVYIGKQDAARYQQATEKGFFAAPSFQKIGDILDASDDLEKPFVAFNSGYASHASNELAQCTQAALQLLDNEKGFFLMVESAGTDKFGHKNSITGKLASVTTLDRTLAAILMFMEENPDTMLVVTSDHETGGVQLPKAGKGLSKRLFTSDDHTGVPVRVFALGQGSEYFSGKTVDNTDIAKFLIAALQQNG